MSAEIRILKDMTDDTYVYPITTGAAVNLDDGTTVQDLADKIDPNILQTAPTFKKIYNSTNGKTYKIYHPYMNRQGAELVLMRYNKRNGKKKERQSERFREFKKGWGIAVGPTGQASYFTFSANTSINDLKTFCLSRFSTNKVHFGIALRLPNPEWTRGATIHKNGIYHGTPESLWSDVLPIRINNTADSWGIGIPL